MLKELKDKSAYRQAQAYAFRYIDSIDEKSVFPSADDLELLRYFDERLPLKSSTSMEVLDMLEQYGSPNTVSQIGGRYFGFVNGSSLPATQSVKWLADIWDQCGGLFKTSPINAKLESVCEAWLKELFELPESTVAGFVSGTSSANLCCLIAARYQVLKNLGWDVNEKGMNGAPQTRIIAHDQVHGSVKKTLAILGYGKSQIEWIPSDNQGRIDLDHLPTLDPSCMVLLQAGNANTGAFDNFEAVCKLANPSGAWVHIDGAFGLWAGATARLKHLTKGINLADSWAVDGHKTLNTPYDCGIAMCKDPTAMITALQATGEYIIYSEERDPILYTQEMSKRSRAIELWAAMKFLGRQGIEQLVDRMHTLSLQLEKGLRDIGLEILNEVVFNQVLVRYHDDQQTEKITSYIQESREVWLGGTTWLGQKAIRNSVCSWVTTEEDIERLVKIYKSAIEQL